MLRGDVGDIDGSLITASSVMVTEDVAIIAINCFGELAKPGFQSFAAEVFLVAMGKDLLVFRLEGCPHEDRQGDDHDGAAKSGPQGVDALSPFQYVTEEEYADHHVDDTSQQLLQGVEILEFQPLGKGDAVGDEQIHKTDRQDEQCDGEQKHIGVLDEFYGQLMKVDFSHYELE